MAATPAITKYIDDFIKTEPNRYLVLLSTKGAMESDVHVFFNNYNKTIKINNKKSNSLICVIGAHNVIRHSAGIVKCVSFYYFTKYDHDFGLISRNYRGESYTSITMDGKEYSVNSQGFNIVVFDKNLGSIIDSVCFESTQSNSCIRNPDYKGTVTRSIHADTKINASVNEINKKLDNLECELTNLYNQNKKLKDLIEIKSQQMFFLHIADSMKKGESYDDARLRFFNSLPKASGNLRMLQLASK